MSNHLIQTIAIALLCLRFVSAASAAENLKSFPGAEGWGAASIGGRGGQVIRVTNLNSAGSGSLAEACATAGPRIVVFDVSGVIRGTVRITHPHITIAGQTAPGAGITIEGMISSFDHGVHDVIIRHLRVRRNRTGGGSGDCLQFGGLGPRKTGTYNIMLDHLSLSWGNDEIIDLYNAHDVTVQWCTIEESDDQGHDKGAHNFGLISAAEGSGAISLHHNLWAHHARRVPCLAPYRENAASDFCNNLIYNCRGGYADDGHGNRAKSAVNIYKNYYLRGPDTQQRMYPFALSPEMDYYVRDNHFEDWGDQHHPQHWRYGGKTPRWLQFNNNGREIDQPAKTPAIEATDARTARDHILARAGCWPRDRVTKRTIDELQNRSGKWGRNAPLDLSDEWFLEGLTHGKTPPDSDSDGLPDAWELAHKLNPKNATDAAKIVPAEASFGDRHLGYTYWEFYLNELADGLTPN